MKTRTAIILAAGYGKRFRPLTNQIPKPLIKIYGKALLGHTIDMLLSCGIRNIVINTHYKSKLINDYLLKNYQQLPITISHESILLDTGGGVKNAVSYFKEKIILVINSDIFWYNLNYQDIKNLLIQYNDQYKCQLLLNNIKNSYGIKKNTGDFCFKKNHLIRNKINNKGLIYSGAQIIDTSILNSFDEKIFSFNKIWDLLIEQKKITGILMSSKWLHLGSQDSLKFLKHFKT